MTYFRAATYNVYYKVKPAQVAAHMRLLRSKGVSVVLLQEINAAKIHALAQDGWKVLKNPRASNAVAWRPETWDLLGSKQVRLAKPYHRSNPKGTVHTESPMVNLRHKQSGRTLWALSYHLPSRVQRKDPAPGRRAVSKEAAATLDRLGKQTATCLFGGDDNVDERHGKIWGYLKNMKNLRQMIAPKGTHGNRRIDDFRIKGLTPGPGEVLNSPSDHHTHVRAFSFPERKPSKPAAGTIKPEPKETKVATSQNGWPALDSGSSKLHIWNIPTKHGNVRIKMRNGSVGFILAWCVLRWAELLEPVKGKVLDDWGYAYRPVRGSTTGLSNHSSGTAVDVNATRWPLGTRNMSAWKRARVAFVIRPVRGVVTWGGVWRRPDQMHLEITKGTRMSACERVAKRLMTTWRGKRILKANPGQKKVIES